MQGPNSKADSPTHAKVGDIALPSPLVDGRLRQFGVSAKVTHCPEFFQLFGYIPLPRLQP